jgi:hypothetical protein
VVNVKRGLDAGRVFGAFALFGAMAAVVATAARVREERVLAEQVKGELRALSECVTEVGHHMDVVERLLAELHARPN